MQVQIESTSNLGRKLILEISAEQFAQKYKNKLNELQKTAKFAGFRPGKAPVNMVETRYGDAIKNELLDALIPEHLYKAFEDNNLKVAGTPSVNIKNFTPDQPITIESTFEVYPEIELKTLANQQITQYVGQIADSDLENAIEVIKKQNAEYKDVDRSAQLTDKIIINANGFIDNKPFAGGKLENATIILGSKTTISGFEEGLLGLKLHEEKDLAVTFPEDYHVKNLAGKSAIFKIKVNAIKEMYLPELNDEFITKLPIKSKNLQEFHNELKTNLGHELEQTIKMKNKKMICDKFLELNNIDAPQNLVEKEADHMRTQEQKRLSEYMHEKKVPQLDKKFFIKPAAQKVKLGLLFGKAITDFAIKVDQLQVNNYIDNLVVTSANPQEDKEHCYRDKKYLEHIELIVMEDQIITEIIKGAIISEKIINLAEALKLNNE